MIINWFNRRMKRLSLLVLFTIVTFASTLYAADVVIIGNKALKPVANVIDEINKTHNLDTTVISPKDAADSYSLNKLIDREAPKAVLALGKGALTSALTLPEDIPLIYGLIINPVDTDRKNITGIYMATPVHKYVSLLSEHFPMIKKVGIVKLPGMEETSGNARMKPELIYYTASNPYEFIEGINTLDSNVDAFLLLPERKLITSSSLEALYLYSFKEKVPVLGISEKYVKSGSLFSLGFDMKDMVKQITSLVGDVIREKRAVDIKPSPPQSFTLHINRQTAKTSGVNVSQKLYRQARRVYP